MEDIRRRLLLDVWATLCAFLSESLTSATKLGHAGLVRRRPEQVTYDALCLA